MRLLKLVTIFLTCTLVVSATEKPFPRIVIVGAGLAGLTAGYRLNHMGYHVEIYEARGRPGGRVLTAYFANGHEELGGQNLDDGNEGETITSLIHELGLKVQTYTYAYRPRFFFDNKIYTWPEIFQNAPSADDTNYLSLKQRVEHTRSLADLIGPFLEENKVLRKLMDMMMKGWEGSSPELLSSANLDLDFWNIYRKNHKICHLLTQQDAVARHKRVVEGGNGLLVQALAETLESCIYYHHPVRQLRQGPGNTIHLKFDHDETIAADYVILALPCSTLRDIDIQEGLFPADQLHAINTLHYGTNAKILIPIANVDPHTAITLFTENEVLWHNHNFSVLTWYLGGESGIFDHFSAEAMKNIIVKQIPQTFMPIVREDALNVRYQQPTGVSWFNEEYSKGGYSNCGIDQYPFFCEVIDDHGESVRKVFRSIDNRIIFAGEHTAPIGAFGTMEGAVLSGERAARLMRAFLPTTDKEHTNSYDD